MNGQWIGNYTGTSPGMIVVNVDERSTHYEGVAYLNENQPTLPSTAASFRTINKDRSFHFQTNVILPINPATGLVDLWDNVKARYPGAGVSARADVQGSWDESRLTMRWDTETGVHGECELPRSKGDQPSELAALEKRWSEYKEYVTTLEGRRYLFR